MSEVGVSEVKAATRSEVRFTLNGVAVTGHAEPRMLLADFLRETLGVTGVHVGCEQGFEVRHGPPPSRSMSRTTAAARRVSAQSMPCVRPRVISWSR